MSHVVKLQLEIKNIKALKKATKKLGLEFNEGVKSFEYYSSSRSNCDHTISSKGARKSIGVCAVSGKKNEFELKWDPGYLDGTTQKLVGNNGENLKKEYAASAATLEAEAQGFFVTRYDNADGTIRLEASV